jgi:hypothetical protein
MSVAKLQGTNSSTPDNNSALDNTTFVVRACKIAIIRSSMYG